MLNPFLQPTPRVNGRKNRPTDGQAAAQMYGQSLDTSSPRPHVGLLVGRLLIRMGEKLVNEEHELKTTGQNA